MSNQGMLPHGAKRHLLNYDSAQVINVILSSGTGLRTGDIEKSISLSNSTIRGRLFRMRDLGIVSMERNTVCTRWSIPLSYQEPIRAYLESAYGNQLQQVKL